MSKIPMELRGRRPRFFPSAGTDETVSMLLELATELWTVKERLYALEAAAADAGVELTSRIEAWRPGPQDAATLEAERRRMIEAVMRALKSEHVDRARVQQELDAGRDPADADESRAA